MAAQSDRLVIFLMPKKRLLGELEGELSVAVAVAVAVVAETDADAELGAEPA